MPKNNEDTLIEKQAVALGYNPDDKNSAPEILATGKGEIAARILLEAQKNKIKVQKDADLVALLSTKEVGDEIPVEAFIAVAEILKYIYAESKKV